MKKPTRSQAPGEAGDVLLHDEWMVETFPLLWEQLTETKWDDRSNRRTSSITMFMASGSLKACLNDKNDGHVAFVASDSVEGLLGALEEGLREGRLDWRKARFGTGRK